jgi:hypothetical protein
MHHASSIVSSTRPSSRTGAMTAVMKAATAHGPRALHIGIYRGNVALQEIVVARGASVTVGSDPKNTLVIDGYAPQGRAEDGRSLTLFQATDRGYILRISKAVRGRLALDTGIVDVTALTAPVDARGLQEIAISETARGQLLVGDLKILFHFIVRAPASRPSLPSTVLGAGVGVDWPLLVIAALSFLGHFGVVGALYSDWLDAPWQEATVAGLVDMVRAIPVPPAPEAPTPPATPEVPRQDVAKKETKTEASAAASKSGPSGAPGAAVGARDAVSLAARADAIELATLGALNGPSAIETALRRSEIPAVDLADLAKESAGASTGGDGIRLAGNHGPVTTTRGPSGLPGGDTHATEGTDRAGRETTTAGPAPVTVGLSPATVTMPIPGVEGTVASLRPRFRKCYQDGLRDDPTMTGKVTLAAKIAPNGDVASSTPEGVVGLSPKVVSCLQGALRRASFGAPGDAGSTVRIPVSFVQQK